MLVRFLTDDEPCDERVVRLTRLDCGAAPQSVGWLRTPPETTHLQLRLEDLPPEALDRVELSPIAEGDPKCHPHANVPRWSAYRRREPHGRVLLPASLGALVDVLGGADVEVMERPRSRAMLASTARARTCIVDPAWVEEPGLTLADLEKLARQAHVIVDLASFAALLARAGGHDKIKTRRYSSPYELMSARVEFADVPTRGFALHDVAPYASVNDEMRFSTHVLRANRAWKSFADAEGVATLLSSETPWENRCGDVLSAAWALGDGELLLTDLPWLVAGRDGPLAAPRLAEHLLRMHVGLPLDDAVQYWTRWEDPRVVLRDIADLTRRFEPLQAVRWASAAGEPAHLGISTPPIEAGEAGRELLIRSGRIDQAGVHDGVPPEPLVIFMKWLAREWRERTPWARRNLARARVTWQFDACEGLRYATQFRAAPVSPTAATRVLRLRVARVETVCGRDRRPNELLAPADSGVFGDRSLAIQEQLTRALRRWIGAGTRRS